MLKYTGHPIADIGVATIAAFCEKTDPSSLTEKDLVKIEEAKGASFPKIRARGNGGSVETGVMSEL